MNKAELIKKLADVLGVRDAIPLKVIGMVVESTFTTITEHMKTGGEVSIIGFGTFSVRLRKSRAGVDPRDPTKRIIIQDVRVAKFRAGNTLKKAIKSKS